MKRKLLLCLTLTLLLGVLSRQLSWAQCTNCVNTAVTGGNYDLTGNQTLCITGNVGDFNLNVSGTGNKICVATGATWTIGFGLNFNTSLTIDVYGTLNANGSYNVNGTGNQAVFNIKPGATMNTNTPGFSNSIRINNEGTLNFTNTGAITNEGSFTLINATTGVVSATATTLFKLGTNSYVENENLMTFSNLENAESDIRNAQGATITIGRYFYNHGNIINDGQINTICGPFGSVACEFIVGDKGPGKIFSISNTGCMSVTGTVTFNGPGFINGTLEITGDLTINKPVSGANGRIIVNNGVSTISLSGAYNGTNMTFCDKNTAGNGFDVVQANNPSTNVVYTVDCSPNLCASADLCVAPSNLTLTAVSGTPAPGATVTLSVSASNTTPGSTSYTWSGPGISSPSATTVASRTLVAPATAGVYTYTVLVSNGTGCTATATRSVTVVALVDGCPGNLLSNGSLENGNFNNFTTTNPSISGTLMTYGGSQSVFLSADPGGNTLPDTPITGFRANTGYWVDATTNGGLGAKDANRLFAIPANVGANKCLFPNSSLGFAYTSGNCYRICFWAAQFDPASPNNSALTSIFNFEYEDSFGVLSPGVASNFSIAPTATSTTGSFQSISWTLPASTNVKTITGATYTGAAGQVVDWKTLNWQYICLDFTPAVTSDRMRIYLSTTNTNNGVAIDGICATACSNSATCAINVTATPGTCNSATNQYAVSGTISLTNAVAGTATITDGAKSTTVTVPAGATSVAYSLTGLISGTGSHTVTVSLPGCGTATAIYAAPASCTVAPCSTSATAQAICNNNGTLDVTSDDYVNILLTPYSNVQGSRFILTATQNGNPISLSLSDGGSLTALSYAYPTPLRAPLGSAGNGNITLILTDVSNTTCITQVTVVDPGECAAAACVGSNPQTVTQSYRTRFQPTELNSVPLLLSKFDDGGGTRTLTGVKLTYGMFEGTNLLFENTAATPTVFRPTVTADIFIDLGATNLSTATLTATPGSQTAPASVTVAAQGSYGGDVLYGTPPAQRLSTLYGMGSWLDDVMIDIYSDPRLDSRWVTNATGNPTTDDDIYVMPPQNLTFSGTNSYSATGDLAQFIGSGQIPLTASTLNGLTLSGGGGNLIYRQWTQAYAYATVEYTYICNSCTLVATATPGTCNSATNQYTVSGTVSLTNNLGGGTATITDGAKSTTVSIPAGATSVAYSLTGLISGTGSHTVTVSLPGCGTATATYNAPASCTVACPSPNCFTLAGQQMPMVFQFGYVGFGTYTTNSGSLTTATAISSAAPNLVNVITSSNIGLVGGNPITLSTPMQFAVGSTYTQTFTTASGSFTANLTVNSSVITGPYAREVEAVGFISSSNAAFALTPILYSASYTQNPGSGQINASFTLSSKAPSCGNLNTICPGSTQSVTLTAQAGITNVVWRDSTTNSIIGTGSTLIVVGTESFLADGYEAVYYEGVDANGCVGKLCCMERISVTKVTATATPGTCNPATNQYAVSGTVSLTSATAGTATITDGAVSTTVTIPAGATAVAYSLTGLTSGTGSHTVTVGLPGCGTATATYTAPASCSVAATINVTSATVCYGNTATLTAAGCTGSVTWSNGTSGNTLVTPTLTQTTSYTATCTTASATTFAVGTVTVLPQPVLNLSASSTLVTTGTNVTLTASGCAGTVNWSNGSTGASIIVTPTQPTQTYSATCTTGPACFTTASIVVNTEAPANLVVTSATICAGSSATLTAAGCAGSVTWSNGTSGNTLVTPTLTQTTNYTATCTTTTSTTFAVGTVTVNPAVTATISAGNLSICVGQTTTLTASGGATYRWSTGATTAAISVSTAGTYSVTATSAAGCSGTATVTVVQHPVPVVTVTSATICAGSSATLTASGANSYLWSTGATTPGIVVSPTATTTYSVTGTSSAGCSDTATGTVTVLPQPVLNLSASSTLVTVGNSVTLTAQDCVGSITWSNGSTGASIVVMPTQPTQTYSATCTTGPACFTTATIVVNTEEPANLVVTSATICAGSSATLTAAGCAGTVTWSNGTTGNTLVTPALTQTTSYTATCTTATSTTFAVGTVTVNPAVTATISAGSLSICAGQTTTLTASGGATYRWSNGATTAAISVSAAGTYSVTATSTAGCSGTSAITVVENPAPIMTVSSASVCVGVSATLTASGADSYLWNTGANTPSIVVSASATTTYSVTGTTAAGCSATATGSLTVFGQPTISPAILPAATVGVTYSQTLTGNSGQSPYTFAVVAGSLPQGLSLSTDGVLAGTPTDNAPASFTVSLTDANGCTAVQPYSTTATGLPKLELNKLVSKRQAQVGEVVSFTVVLANTGLASATGVVVSDTHTAGMSILPGSVTVSTGSFTPGLNGGQWAIASLPAGTTATLTYSASITGEGIIYNTASIPGTPTTDVKTCLSVPMQVCQGAPFAIKVNAPEGYSRYQWYLTAPGATSSTLVADGTLNSFTATLPGSYSVLIDGGLANTCPSQGCCPVVIEEIAVPSYTALVKNSSCVGSTPQADGHITLVNLGTAGRYYYQVSPGTSFDSAGASAVAAIPANGVVSTGLLPGNYTVRVWLMINGQPACPRDLTVAVVETCACPTNVCVPVVVRKIK